jgi:hypothetical protein
MYGGTDGKMRFGNNAGTVGAYLDVTTADTVTIRNFVDSALGSLACANVTASALGKLGTYTVSTLPSASSNTYAEANVSDSLSPAIGSTVASGGSAKAKVWSNGTNWIVVGK